MSGTTERRATMSSTTLPDTRYELSALFKDFLQIDNKMNIEKHSESLQSIEYPQNVLDAINDIPFNSTWDPCSVSQLNKSHCQSIVSEFTTSNHWFSPMSETILVVCYCIVIMLGILGNSVVVYVVLKFKHLQKPRNILILNLSVCGIIMCVACMPFSLIRLTLKNWQLGEVMCRISPSLQTLDVFVSTFSIVAIAVDRYSAIVCASKEASNKRLVFYSIVLMWLVSIMLCIPMLAFHEVHDVYPESMDVKLYKICMEMWPADIWKKLYTTTVLVIQYAAPLTIISCLHARICTFLRLRINENPRTERELSRVLKDIKRQRKNMLLLTAIAVTFAVAWLPLTVLNTLADYDYTLFMNRKFNHAYAYCLLGAMFSACMNPIIYGWFNTNFRTAFIQVLLHQNKTSDNGNMEMATIKNDSKGNSNQPFRFYSSLQLDMPRSGSKRSQSSSKGSRSSFRSNRSVSPKVNEPPSDIKE